MNPGASELDLCAILIGIFSLIIETFKRVQTAEKVLTRPHKEETSQWICLLLLLTDFMFISGSR